LRYVNELYEDITYISYFTVKPSTSDVGEYLKKFAETYLENSNNRAKFMGRRTANIDQKNIPNKVRLYENIEDLVKDL
jgi:hypothetical protein